MDALRFVDNLIRRQQKSGAEELLDLLKNPFEAQVSFNSYPLLSGISLILPT